MSLLATILDAQITLEGPTLWIAAISTIYAMLKFSAKMAK